MISFVHTADVHFGVENYGRIDAATGLNSRLLDFYKAFQECINRALDERVDLFIFAGDAYKTAHPTPTQQRLFMQSLLRLFRAHIPVVIVVGNHDNALSFGKAHALEIFGQIPLDGFYVISQPTSLQIMTRQGPVNIVGIPWPARAHVALHKDHALLSGPELAQAMSATVSELISQYAQQLDPQIPAILVGHLTVSSGIFSGSEKRAICGTDPIFLPSQLSVAPFDYVALGHLHRYQVVNRGEYPEIVYSGSIERVDFGERKEEKGFCLGKIHAKGTTEHTFIPVKTRPLVQVHVSCNDTEDITTQIIAHLERYTLTDAIVKIVYQVPPGSSDKVDVAALHAACRGVHYLAGIIPLKQFAAAKRYTGASLHDVSLSTLLRTYLDAKNIGPERVEVMMKKAALIADEQGMSLDSSCSYGFGVGSGVPEGSCDTQ